MFRAFLAALLASFALAAAAPSHALPPNLKPVILTAPRAADYVPNAISVLPTFAVQLAQPADNTHFFLHMIVRGSGGTCTNPFPIQGTNNLNIVGSDFGTSVAPSAEDMRGGALVLDNSTCPGGSLRFAANDPTTARTGGGSGNNHGAAFSYGVTNTTPGLRAGDYTDVIVAGDALESGALRGFLMLNGKKAADLNQVGTWSTNLTFGFSQNAMLMNWITGGGAGSGGRFDISELMFDTPSVNPVDASNNPTFDVSKFWKNGKPVDIGADCSKPFGVKPLICHNGPASTWLTNTGTGGNASVASGSNSFANKAFPAPIRPNERPTGPWVAWVVYDSLSCSGTPATCTGITTKGYPIEKGDLLEVDVEGSDSTGGGVDKDPVVSGCPVTGCSNSWALVPNSKLPASGTNALNRKTYYKIAESQDVTAPGIEWANAPSVALNAANYNYTRTYAVYIIKNVNQAAPFVASQATMVAAASGLGCPTLSATGPNQLYLCGFSTFDMGFETGKNVGPWSAGSVANILPQSGTGANVSSLFWEKTTAAGSIARTSQESAPLGNAAGILAQILQ